MKLYKFIFLSLLGSAMANGQSCLHKNLSQKFDFRTGWKKLEKNAGEVSVSVIEKKTQRNIQTVKFSSGFIFETGFSDCAAVRSYATGTNKNEVATDNDFGDFIVADFNFDGKDDFAVKKDSGGNGGPLYAYYIQNGNSQFIPDNFLSDTVVFFPSEIDRAKKRLTTFVHANAYQQSKNVYQYDSKTKKWKTVSETLIDNK